MSQRIVTELRRVVARVPGWVAVAGILGTLGCGCIFGSDCDHYATVCRKFDLLALCASTGACETTGGIVRHDGPGQIVWNVFKSGHVEILGASPHASVGVLPILGIEASNCGFDFSGCISVMVDGAPLSCSFVSVKATPGSVHGECELPARFDKISIDVSGTLAMQVYLTEPVCTDAQPACGL